MTLHMNKFTTIVITTYIFVMKYLQTLVYSASEFLFFYFFKKMFNYISYVSLQQVMLSWNFLVYTLFIYMQADPGRINTYTRTTHVIHALSSQPLSSKLG